MFETIAAMMSAKYEENKDEDAFYFKWLTAGRICLDHFEVLTMKAE